LPPWVNSLLMKLELQLAVRLEILRNLEDEVRRIFPQEVCDLETIAVEELAGDENDDSSKGLVVAPLGWCFETQFY
jgi:hypothetical protein